MSTSPTTTTTVVAPITSKKLERIQFINRLIQDLDCINKSNDGLFAQIPNQIQDSYNIVTRFMEHLEDYKPFNQKNLSKSFNIKIMELEKSINQLKTRIRDNQIRSNNINSQKEIERELQIKIRELDELRKKLSNQQQQQQQHQQHQSHHIPSSSSSSSITSSSPISSSPHLVHSLSTNTLNSSNGISNNNNNNNNNEKLKLIKSDLTSLLVSIQKIYSSTMIFYSTFKTYFNTLVEVTNRIPTMRGGLEIAGVISIGVDESTEILERMAESIYQSSKLAWTFIGELPCVEKSWYTKNFKLYRDVIEKTNHQEKSLDEKSSNINNSNKNNSSSNNNNNNNKENSKKSSDNVGIMSVLKRLNKKNTYRSSLNLLEKITIMENENASQQKLNQSLTNNSPPLQSKTTTTTNTSPHHQNNKISTTTNKKIIYEPINSSSMMLDAIILDLDKLLSFSDKEITSHIDSLEKKCQMVFDLLLLMKSRYQYFREKISRWVENNSTILRVTSYESDQESFKIPNFKCVTDIQYKMKVLYKVLLSYFTTCLIATPMVYLSPDSWKLSNHADYRLEKRQQIEKLLLVLKSNYPIDFDVLRKLILEFTDILLSVLDIQIPLMLEVYQDDSTLKRKNWSNERKLLKETISKSINQLKYFEPNSLSSSFGTSNNVNNISNNNPLYLEMLGTSVQMIQSVLLQFFNYKPVARPHIYKNDKDWKLISESKTRYEYRVQIVI